MVHVTRLNTAHAIWQSLQAIHETRDYQIAISIQRTLFRRCASDGDDIIDHLTQLKRDWERLNIIDDSDFRVTDIQFKTIIASSLPPSWDTFTEPYVGRRVGIVEVDPKKLSSSQQFIGILKEEYIKRKERTDNGQKTYHVGSTNNGKGKNGSQPLMHRIQDKGTGMLCRNCGHNTHTTDNCRWLGQPKCNKCNWFGHVGAECRRQSSKRKSNSNGKGGGPPKKAKKEEVNHVAENGGSDGEDELDELAESGKDEIVFSTTTASTSCNTFSQNDDAMILYEWLADCATTSHVTNRRELLINYTPLQRSVRGVGNVQTCAEGRGDIRVKSIINGTEHQLTLRDVLYIPGNQQNLLSLGRWDKAGGTYQGGQGKLAMIASNGDTVAAGTRISNNLYMLDNFVAQQPATKQDPEKQKQGSSTYAFATSATGPAQTWETWHKRFGHLGRSGLKTLVDKGLVTGLDLDLNSPQYDCAACVQAKQYATPFPKASISVSTKPGEITHMDLWGKYPIQSINGNQYFHTFLDDSTRRPSLSFLKHKDEAAQAVKNYVAYLKARGMHPHAFRCDQGAEFLNDKLVLWLREQGIELQTTAPYSPSQNGAAERLNRTLVELARAMMIGANVPMFLWEYALQHAAYLRERAPTKALPGTTPYEAWHTSKPDVSHLREFGSPVYVLLQGSQKQPKLLPKSKQQIFVGYDDGSKSIKYYNPETRRVLTSRNYQFLTNLPRQPGTPESIVVELPPAVPREGEHDGGQPNSTTLQPESQPSKRKREEGPQTEAENDPPERNLRRQQPVNYRKLQDPFSDEEEADEAHYTYTITIMHALLGTDEPKTVQEARASAEWPEWEKAIRTELDQLDQFGTWRLVESPPNAIPIPNKWVLTKKYNRQGELTKYKARLVVKGCAQRPGFDYTETFSPVVRLETIRAILALVPSKQLKMHQLDVKGAYLNGVLEEEVYMRQPDGFGDGTRRVCRLQKTLYGLKQSGREWNKELDRRLRGKVFNSLRSDPCAYIRQDGDDLEIVTVWVDDLLLFTTSDSVMRKLTADLKSVFDVTDLGEPSKIVGIEITHRGDSLTISQPQYVNSILRKYKMEDANPVSTPLDPNIKLRPNEDKREANRSNDYASLMGSLQYLAIATRPDIAYAVNRLAAYTANPSFEHYTAAKRVLRYIKGTQNYGITYRDHNTKLIGPPDSNLFYGFSDAAYANADDQRSISGYVFLSNMGAITWMSKKQTTIALSTTEAEYVALSEASREAIWLRHLYGELGFVQKEPIILLGDNDGSVSMTKNAQFHKRTKHIDLRWHWVRNLVNDGLVNVIDCRDAQQTADIMTKSLPRPKYVRHVNELGLNDASAI
jgi:hypothetical protein